MKLTIPRADDYYFRIDIGPLQRLEHPVPLRPCAASPSFTPRCTACTLRTDVRDLFYREDPFDKLWRALRSNRLRPMANRIVEEWPVDITLRARGGYLGIRCSNDPSMRSQTREVQPIPGARSLGDPLAAARRAGKRHGGLPAQHRLHADQSRRLRAERRLTLEESMTNHRFQPIEAVHNPRARSFVRRRGCWSAHSPSRSFSAFSRRRLPLRSRFQRPIRPETHAQAPKPRRTTSIYHNWRQRANMRLFARLCQAPTTALCP